MSISFSTDLNSSAPFHAKVRVRSHQSTSFCCLQKKERGVFLESEKLVDMGLASSERSYSLLFVSKLVMVASLGGFLFGYDTGIISGAQLYFKNDFPLITEFQKEMIVSMAQFGAFVGALLAGPVSDKFGRKPVIVLADLLFIIGSIQMYLAHTIDDLIFGRITVGLGVGLASLIVPIFLSELSPTEVRGLVVAVDVLVITLGQFLSSLISLYLGSNWRLMLGFGAVPAILQLLGMLAMPESQRWLAKQGKNKRCISVIKQIYSNSHSEAKYTALKEEMQGMSSQIQMKEGERLRELFTNYRKCLFIGCGLQFF
mmetsp:Transcript_10434/g.17521  ORF Transcript_10434/g.17521 Transcript_10434/m.17521 type:complete len:314 (-) Transcript_10434:23-964(-)